jgi:hypothetical protein
MTPTRQEILERMADFIALFPTFRFGQAVSNFCSLGWEGDADHAIGQIDDEAYLASLEHLLAFNAGREPAPRDMSHDDYYDAQTWHGIFDLIRELSELHPSWRFGQLVGQVTEWARDERDWGIYDVEDTDFVAAARRHLDEHRHVSRAS